MDVSLGCIFFTKKKKNESGEFHFGYDSRRNSKDLLLSETGTNYKRITAYSL